MEALITKLPAEINDDTLYHIGEFRVALNFNSGVAANNRKMTFTFSKPATLYLVGNAHFTDSTLSDDDGKIKEVAANVSTDVYVSDGECILKVACDYECINFSGSGVANAGKISCRSFADDKFKFQKPTALSLSDFGLGPVKLEECDLSNVTSFTLNYTPSVEFDLDDVNLGVALGSLSLFGGSKVKGTTAKLGELTGLVNCVIQGTLITGDIASMSTCTKLTTLQIGPNTGITGTLESFASAMNLTRKSGSLSFRAGNSGITYNGESISGNLTITFSASGYEVS